MYVYTGKKLFPLGLANFLFLFTVYSIMGLLLSWNQSSNWHVKAVLLNTQLWHIIIMWQFISGTSSTFSYQWQLFNPKYNINMWLLNVSLFSRWFCSYLSAADCVSCFVLVHICYCCIELSLSLSYCVLSFCRLFLVWYVH